MMVLSCRSPGRPVERSGSGEAGEGRTQAHAGGSPTEIQGPRGGQACPACRPQEPGEQIQTQPVTTSFPDTFSKVVACVIKTR